MCANVQATSRKSSMSLLSRWHGFMQVSWIVEHSSTSITGESPEVQIADLVKISLARQRYAPSPRILRTPSDVRLCRVVCEPARAAKLFQILQLDEQPGKGRTTKANVSTFDPGLTLWSRAFFQWAERIEPFTLLPASSLTGSSSF